MAKFSQAQFDDFAHRVKDALDEAGLAIESQRPIDYGLCLLLHGGGMLNLYNGKKGFSAVAAGKLSEQEKSAIMDAVSPLLPESASVTKSSTVSSGNSLPANMMGHKAPWIGCDEAGKGDWFGPLVVAAVLVKPSQVAELIAAGLRDSKALSDNKNLAMSGWIEKHLPHAIRVLMPPDYNQRYPGNLNHLLSDLHAEVIGELALAHDACLAISDQFGNPARIREKLRQAGADVNLTSVPKAEADIAVAAASVLARGLFLQGLKELSLEATMELPPGAGPQVLAAGRGLVRLLGEDELVKYAKLHFKTTNDVLGR